MKKERSLLFAVITIVFFSVINSAVVAETNEILINEFVSNPQIDWDENGIVGASDEFIELHNPGISSVIIDNWKLKMIDSNNATQILSGTIPAGGYMVFQNPSGQLENDGRIELYNTTDGLVDSISYGNYDDGNISDNAPDGLASTIYNECLARYPDGQDTENDSEDFIKTLCTYESSNNFSFTPVNITDRPALPSCALETDSVTLTANVSGSIAQVTLSINTNGTWTEILLPGTDPGEFTYILDSSQLEGDTILQWQFSVLDVIGNTTNGQVGSLPINSITALQVFPSEPTGLNRWYITEPQFELSNPSATEILYRWNGVSFTYVEPFGLEGTPNGGNVTGGTHALYYNSNVCSEPEKEFMGKFDFTNPEIKSLSPAPSSVNFNEQPITVSAYIDEVYQGNSGVNLSSVIMEIDGSQVPVTVEASGALDAEAVYLGNLSDGEHEVFIFTEDKSGRSSSTSWNFELITPTVFEMNINLPTEEIYMERRIQFNITLSREADELLYINENDPNPRYKRLCRECEGFGFDRTRFKSLREGENTLTFQAIDGIDVIEQSLFLTIDSREPRIRKTEPRSGLASGEFEIEFDEDNPTKLTLHYGNRAMGFDQVDFNIATECEKDRRYHCIKTVDLSRFDGHEIEYYVSLEDIAGNKDESRPRTLDVDISNPIINSFGFEVEGKYATFTLDVEEPYLDEIIYKDLLEENPRERRLCISLQDGMCRRKVSFDEGDHEVVVIARDEAGNEAEATANFFTDSRRPRIKSTEPRRGFASGEFEVKFEEVNPSEVFLTYGTLLEKRHTPIELSNCQTDRKNLVCTISVNLSDFEEQEIEYSFNITDIVQNYDESRPQQLDVDTLPPTITGFNHSIEDRELIYRIGVEDPNFDGVVYIDREDPNPRVRTLCSRLDEGICEGEKRFRRGLHTLDIKALDEAGNEATIAENLEFVV